MSDGVPAKNVHHWLHRDARRKPGTNQRFPKADAFPQAVQDAESPRQAIVPSGSAIIASFLTLARLQT